MREPENVSSFFAAIKYHLFAWVLRLYISLIFCRTKERGRPSSWQVKLYIYYLHPFTIFKLQRIHVSHVPLPFTIYIYIFTFSPHLRVGSQQTRWTPGRSRSAAALCVAGAVLGDSVAALCVAGAVLGDSVAALCVAGAALRGSQQTRWTPGRSRSAAALCVAGAVLGDSVAALCVAGAVLGDSAVWEETDRQTKGTSLTSHVGLSGPLILKPKSRVQFGWTATGQPLEPLWQESRTVIGEHPLLQFCNWYIGESCITYICVYIYIYLYHTVSFNIWTIHSNTTQMQRGTAMYHVHRLKTESTRGCQWLTHLISPKLQAAHEFFHIFERTNVVVLSVDEPQRHLLLLCQPAQLASSRPANHRGCGIMWYPAKKCSDTPLWFREILNQKTV